MATEHENLCAEILLAISASGGMAFKNKQVYGTFPDGTTPMRGGLGPGTPDVVGVMDDGRAIVVDAKIGEDRLSTKQRNCMEAVVSLGGYAVEVRDIREFQAWLASAPYPGGEIVVC